MFVESIRQIILVKKMKEQEDDHLQGTKQEVKVIVNKYKECRKNHAAHMGKYAVDGCCEFMAAGEEGSAAALTCAACMCHRNFHKMRSEMIVIEISHHYCKSSCQSTSIFRHASKFN